MENGLATAIVIPTSRTHPLPQVVLTSFHCYKDVVR